MRRRMKLKKKSKNYIILIGLPVLVYLLYHAIGGINFRLAPTNEEFLNYLLENSNHYVKEKNESSLTKVFSLVNNININNPVTILEKSFSYVEEDTKAVSATNNSTSFNYVTNTFSNGPRIYIYNTHPNEGYAGKGLEEYSNLSNGVMMATYVMRDRFEELGIPTLVEKLSATDYINQYKLPYTQSYQATRTFLKNTLEEYDNFDLIIDLHRDAVSKEASTVIINGKSYAKVMFVMNPNYSKNTNLAKKISDKLEKKYPGISRGIYDKHQSSFNQDLNSNVILLELGANHNTSDEVLNTIYAFTEIVKEILNEG